MTPKEIPRIPMPDPAEFFREYVDRRRPVVLTDLFAGQPISSIQTAEDATRAWGSVKLQLQEEYTSAEGAATSTQSVMTLRDYAELAATNPATRLCCTEYDTPARVLASYQLPPACLVSSPPEDEIYGLPKRYGDFDLATAIFIANGSNVGHLHFDGDQREVLLHQVYGRKRVVLFQPAAAIHLETLDGPYSRPSLSGVYLEKMDLDAKLSFVGAHEGFHTVLEPGETIYIPMLMWHHLEYLEHAMSFNVRFGRTRFGRFLSLDNFHRDPYIQNVASKMVGPEEVLRSFDPVVDEIKHEYEKPAADMHEKVRGIRALFRRLCGQVSPEAHPERLCPLEREEEQVSRIVESKDMQGALKYADPAIIAGTRPVGPITERQKSIIQQSTDRCGYSAEVAQAVFFNRVGKADLDVMTKAEAAQLISYLASPGAAW